jgi:putative peptide zinc metalloprotease protein
MEERFFSDHWYRVAPIVPALHPQVRLERRRSPAPAHYIAFDAVSGKTHRLPVAAAQFVARMDGVASIAEIWDSLVRDRGEDAPSQEDVVRLLSQLHNADLVRADLPADIAELDERRGKQARAVLQQNLMGPLSFRVPLFDPWPFLGATLPLVRPLVSPLGMVLWLALMVWAGLGALAEAPAIAAAVTDQVWTASSIAIGIGTYVVMKAVHELGHGWVARRFGAEVREMGVMFLVFIPVPYVEASEAAALASRWQRAAVSAAGIIVETTLAALAFLAWREMEPGLARAVAFNVMLIGSLSTVLVNGNPLLKFDGYFVMTDMFGLPNLAQRATKFWGDFTQGRLFGAEDIRPRPDSLRERAVFALYAPLAFGYRVFLSITIAAYVAGSFFVLGVILAIWSVGLSLGKPVAKALWHLFTAPVLHRVRRRAVTMTVGGVALLAGLPFVVPLPHATVTQGVIWAGPGTEVRATAPGRVAEVLVASGAAVARGDALVRLDDPLAEARLAALRWRVEEARLALAAERVISPATARLREIELETAARDLAREEERQAARTLRAATSGRFAPRIAAADLPGRFLPEGQAVADILRPGAALVRIVVPQAGIGAVQAGVRRVELRLPHRPGELAQTRLATRLPAAADRLPSAILGLSRGGVVPTDPADPDGLRTLDRVFVLDAELPPGLHDAPQGGRVLVRLVHAPRPPGLALSDWLRRQFLRGPDV